MRIRASEPSDLRAISRVHRDAFGPEEGPEIVDLVSDLLEDETAHPCLSLVAETGEALVGHVLFTAARVDSGNEIPIASILAPLGILREFQRQGVGGLLVDAGLRILEDRHVDLVFVLGHPSYYPRFGFQPAGAMGFEAPYPIPAKDAGAWMVRVSNPGSVRRFAGTVACASALDRPELWIE